MLAGFLKNCLGTDLQYPNSTNITIFKCEHQNTPTDNKSMIKFIIQCVQNLLAHGSNATLNLASKRDLKN